MEQITKKIAIPKDIESELIKLAIEQDIDINELVSKVLEEKLKEFKEEKEEELKRNKRFKYSDEKIIEINDKVIKFLDIKAKEYKIIYLLATKYKMRLRDILNLRVYNYEHNKLWFRSMKTGKVTVINILDDEIINYFEYVKSKELLTILMFKGRFNKGIGKIRVYQVIKNAIENLEYDIEVFDLIYRVRRLGESKISNTPKDLLSNRII